MESLKQKASKASDRIDQEVEENASNWSEIVKGLVDKLTGKDMAITYEFDDLEIDIPKAAGPGGQEIGSAKWKINGRFVISTQVQDKNKVSGRI
jgi:protein subunit release factor B